MKINPLLKEILKFMDNPNIDTMSEDEVNHELYIIIRKYISKRIQPLELF